MNNGVVHLVSTIIRNAMLYVAESKIAAMYLNSKYDVIIRNTSEEIFHPNTKTPLNTNNSTAQGIVNRNILQKLSKATDIRFYCLGNRENQKHFQVHWAPGLQHIGGYHIKHHQAAHSCAVYNIYLDI